MQIDRISLRDLFHFACIHSSKPTYAFEASSSFKCIKGFSRQFLFCIYNTKNVQRFKISLNKTKKIMQNVIVNRRKHAKNQGCNLEIRKRIKYIIIIYG